MKICLIGSIALAFLLTSCSNSSDKKATPNKVDTGATKKAVTKNQQPDANTKKPPILNIVDTVSSKRIIVCMSDSAANYERIAIKLAQIYGAKLADVFRKNKITPAGPPMAWYKSQKAPYFFEAGIPVNKRPAKLAKGVFIRETNADSVILVHFFGPYDLIPQGYAAVKEWMKDNKRSFSGGAYEIYITDPLDKKGKPVDPYKVQTDIIMTRK